MPASEPIEQQAVLIDTHSLQLISKNVLACSQFVSKEPPLKNQRGM
jgi:hypothetical protein